MIVLRKKFRVGIFYLLWKVIDVIKITWNLDRDSDICSVFKSVIKAQAFLISYYSVLFKTTGDDYYRIQGPNAGVSTQGLYFDITWSNLTVC